MLAGSIIGLAISNPVLAVVLAFVSHFVMDALPHFGYAGRKGYAEVLQHRLSYIVAWFTAGSTAVVILFLAWHGQWFAIFTGTIAALPDSFGIYNWLAHEKHGRRAKGLLRILHVEFHRKIQWCERPWGSSLETAATLILGTVLWRMVI
jgi:hypothetical protein